MGHHTTQRGFTIVELLVVIVVIAILATIVIVSYRGITTSAYNTQVIAGTKSYYEAIVTYKLIKHKYPQTQLEVDGEHLAMTCLGEGYKDQHCGEVTGVDVYEDAKFKADMKDFLKSATSPVSSMLIPVPGESYVGAIYGIDTTGKSSTGYGRVIEYALHGHNTDCGISDAYIYSSSSDSTACEILLEEISF